ncbi:putative phosphatidate phosphatase [Agrilus planipennis]|uniref:Phosphatidate phosphatase n=1 Tax=Agrilus planipennis TaxID=224129 RepID=A0A1W4XGY0_AGRPL|nr:putative phosphatidate phosphatase [Agrilus planipennis]
MENPRIINVPLTKIFIDLVLLAAVGFPILFLFLWGEAFHRGFFCNDETLLHPFHKSTVPSFYLYIFGVGVTSAVIITTEVITSLNNNTRVALVGKQLPYWLWRAYIMLAVFVFGCFCSQLITDVLKYTVGRLRPHFLTVCVPDINCSLPENLHKFHTDFKCTNPLYINDKRIMKELRLSFPSGHSSFSMFTMVFFSIYLQSRFSWEGSHFLKHTLQFLAIASAIYTGMTRISDYKHHWSDVLAGLTMGALTAILITRYVSPLFDREKYYKTNYDSELSQLNVNGSRAQHV